MAGPFPIVSVAEMRALESAAIAAGTPELELQERAGRAVAEVVAAELGDRRAVVAVLVGSGNNGRDAVVAARHLAAWGHRLNLFLSPRHALTEAEVGSLAAAGMSIDGLADPDADARLRTSFADVDLVIDGLLGVGARGPMRPNLAAVTRILNEARAERRGLRVVAVDVPSGVDAEEGTVPGEAVRADVTVTFGAFKAGLLRFPAAALAGRLEPRAIGLPADALADRPTYVLDQTVVRPLLPERPADVHKYRLGRVLVVAGSDMFLGAPYLCSAAAARAGCGLVAVATTAMVKPVLAARLPEATYPVPPLNVEADRVAAADVLVERLSEYAALLLGPGLGRSDATARFVRRLLRGNGGAAKPVPAVIDADALTLLAGWEGWPDEIGHGHVLTPHAGEMARLVGPGGGHGADPPWEQARVAARAWRQVVVLKGPFTAVADPEGRVGVYPHANPALATAGTGDVLAGLCAGLVAQGVPPFDAARLAVVAHAMAGRRVVDERKWRTLLASDLLAEIPAVLWELEHER